MAIIHLTDGITYEITEQGIKKCFGDRVIPGLVTIEEVRMHLTKLDRLNGEPIVYRFEED